MQELEKIMKEIEQVKREPWYRLNNYDVKHKLDGAINQIINILRKHMDDGWIPVENRLPEKEYYTALSVTDKNHYCVAVHNREYGFRTGDIDVEGEIIAWMPLPDPYRSEPLETRKELEED